MFVVSYSGPFGFIKPWTALRDNITFSQQFLTPSIIRGIEMKLFPETLNDGPEIKRIIRHNLTYTNIHLMMERTQAKKPKIDKKKKYLNYNTSIINRGVLINPELRLAFVSENDASIASREHICLCRNEDILLPAQTIEEMTDEEFDQLHGYELKLNDEDAFQVGYNRFDGGNPMYGTLRITGVPVKDQRVEL